jgi:putative glutamine amidotransferase
VPILIPLALDPSALLRFFAQADGLLLTGGGDIAPERYAAPPSPRIRSVDPERDALELLLARWAVERGKPILGICRGLQVINIALGGTLIQDIASEVPGALPHDGPDTPPDAVLHDVDVAEGSLLRALTGLASVEANSSHHQAAQQLGIGLEATARSADGIVEALEAAGHPFAVAVQWHPERLWGRPETRGLFMGLIRAAAGGSPLS